MFRLTFELKLESGYHVGAGYGKGFNVDSALLREADGTPVLRGSTLTGLLRDGADRLLKLPPLSKHPRHETLGRLFGTASRAKPWRVASAHPVERRTDDALAVQRVRIDPCTRRAQPRKLFSQEEGLAGQVFSFAVTGPPHVHDGILQEAALLVAAARNVRQLGRSRRRGLGECVIHLTAAEGVEDARKPAAETWEDWFLNLFDRVWLRGNPAPVTQAAVKSDIQSINAATGVSVRVRVIVRLDEPLLIAQRSVAGNQFETRPVIPGSTLLGALAAMAVERCDLADPKTYHDFTAWFRRDAVSFPMLLPARYYSSHLYPAIPAPLGLVTCALQPFQDESEGHGIHPAGAHPKCPRCGSRLKPVEGFITLGTSTPYTITPRQTSEMHIRIDPDSTMQRAAKGDLYGYTVLSAGQYFVGELLCADEATWEGLQKLTGIAEKTPLVWRLGKACRRGYGKVTVWLERCDDRPQIWVQSPLAQRVGDPSQPLTLTLLTDTIVANTWEQQAAGFAPDWLERALGLGPLKMLKTSYAVVRLVDSFNATLGLPRWRDTAMAGGASASIRLHNPPLDWAVRMERLETEGIGLRRNEGFGRLVFNHPVYDGRQGAHDSHIRLDPRMRPPGRPQPDTFSQYWKEKLPEFLPSEAGRPSCLTALARLLHSHSGDHPQEMYTYLKAFGEPSGALIDAIGESEYGHRSKPGFFQDGGKKYINGIVKGLEYLQKKEDPQNWQAGMEQMAEWVAMLAREEADRQ
ncbi:MAG: RAMP superfamily CRISPR-associated protein [Peptococcaceae bacterium]|jgi:CRISPR-associated protein Csx10|nr:RAMP superfamily CRISPR-associated protein [Peptococcaceae bacterium]